MTEHVYIARCPEHGFGVRVDRSFPSVSVCGTCGRRVEQVPMIPVEGLTDEMVERAARAIEFDSKLSYESTARAALLAAGPWTGKLDREKAIEVATSIASAHEPDDPTEGLPDDLAAVLRDQSIIVPQDAGVFDLIAKWRDAPSNTASADETGGSE